MLTESVVEGRIRELEDEEFTEFVAAVWRQAGWQVHDASDDTVVVSRDGIDGHERVALRTVTPGGAVTTETMHDAVSRTEALETDEVATVTPTEYTPDALEVADAYGVDAIGPDAVARIVVALDADDVFD